MKTKEDVFEELIATVERNAIDNEAHITNVKLWASSWRREYAQQSKWVSVEERLPEKNGLYLCFTDENQAKNSISKSQPYLLSYMNGLWVYPMSDDEMNDLTAFFEKVGINLIPTHWQPLPTPPHPKH